jgi:hypothetical protein
MVQYPVIFLSLSSTAQRVDLTAIQPLLTAFYEAGKVRLELTTSGFGDQCSTN